MSRPPRAPYPSLPPPEPEDALATAPRFDGRRTHIVDRAADYVALHARGANVAQIARRRRRSKGYVSILLRLGQVLATLPPAERAAMRSPRITWALAQRLIRADTPPSEVRAQLRYALGGFSIHNIDRRRRGMRRPRGNASGSDVPAAPNGARTAAGGMLTGWGFDQALLASDPAAFVRAHLERLLAVHHAVERRAVRETQAAAARSAADQSLRRLAAAMQGAAVATGAHAASLRALTVFRAGLSAAARGALRELGAEPDAPNGRASGPGVASAEEVDEDLR